MMLKEFLGDTPQIRLLNRLILANSLSIPYVYDEIGILPTQGNAIVEKFVKLGIIIRHDGEIQANNRHGLIIALRNLNSLLSQREGFFLGT